MKRLFRNTGYGLFIALVITALAPTLTIGDWNGIVAATAAIGESVPAGEGEETASSPSPASYGEGTYIPCTTGLLTYYNQSDPRWADALYGPTDPMAAFGCGPTALAMVVSSYTSTTITPPEMAVWASDNGYCSRGEGSRHELIPEGLTHFGLVVTPISDRSTGAVLEELRKSRIVIALMNKGYFTNGGHFLLLTQITEDGTIRIADPASWENTTKSWDLEFILSQVRSRAEAGGPLWSVEMPPEA